jgi:YfiH family protein
MSLVYGKTQGALNNRKNFLLSLGIDYQDLVCARQSHGNNVRYVQETDRGKGAVSCDTALDDTDALITDKGNVPLAVFTADCLSIFLYDPVTSSIGLIHAGWQGSRKGIAARTIEAMKKQFNSRAEDLYAGLGPAIRDCCYEVGGDFKEIFPQNLIARGSRYYLDLIGINKRQLLESGAKEANIFDSRICTSCQNKEFFSYRKEGSSCGRMLSVIMLRYA